MSEPMPRGGSISPLEKYSHRIPALITNQPDLTLDEMVCALHKRRIPASRSALSRSSARRHITVKKPTSSRAAAGRRGSGATTLDPRAMVDPAHVVFAGNDGTLCGRCCASGRLLGSPEQIGNAEVDDKRTRGQPPRLRRAPGRRSRVGRSRWQRRDLSGGRTVS
jgi:hypothetical protein